MYGSNVTLSSVYEGRKMRFILYPEELRKVWYFLSFISKSVTESKEFDIDVSSLFNHKKPILNAKLQASKKIKKRCENIEKRLEYFNVWRKVKEIRRYTEHVVFREILRNKEKKYKNQCNSSRWPPAMLRKKNYLSVYSDYKLYS